MPCENKADVPSPVSRSSIVATRRNYCTFRQTCISLYRFVVILGSLNYQPNRSRENIKKEKNNKKEEEMRGTEEEEREGCMVERRKKSREIEGREIRWYGVSVSSGVPI